MKLLHLGDLHLGKALGEFDLYDDQKHILERILKIITEKKVDAVLLAGDIYDRAIPSEAATNLLDYFLNSLVQLKVSVYIISGNHDSDDRLNFGSSLFTSNKVYISSKFTGSLYRHTEKDEHGEVDFYLLPFVKASQVRHFYPDANIETYEDAVRTIIENAQIDPARRNVILAHQFVVGSNLDPVLGGSEGTAVQSVGTVERIGYKVFDGFDYAALGHIHSAQSIGRPEVRYSGSPLKYSLSEANNDKSVPVINLGKKGETDIELVPLKPRRDLRHIKGELKTLLNRKNIQSPDDFIYVTLTDEDPINDAMGIIQQEYRNTVRLDYCNSHTKEMEQAGPNRITEEKSLEELVSDFYRMMYGCDISEEELKYMKKAAKEAGIADEAD